MLLDLRMELEMISSSLRAFWLALARRIQAPRRLDPEHLCAKVTAAAEASAEAYDDEHLPARVASDESSVAAGRRG